MKLPSPLVAALQALRSAGGEPQVVGGCVRDWLLGLEPKDFDVEVFKMDFATMGRVLAPFGVTDVVGSSFGVLKVRIGGIEYDFSLPRRESKTGAGHRGFAIEPDPALTRAEAAARRDFTINAIAFDPFSEHLIDPHNGEKDLRAKVLRHTSDAFAEDPLRVLRGFQLAARFRLRMAPETVALCRSIRQTYPELAVERVWAEWDKWAVLAVQPSLGLAVLKETRWLAHFPEIAALDELPQEPEWHPEGDVLTHTGHCLDAVVGLPAWKNGDAAERRILSLAVLAHDFGKSGTTHQAMKRGQLRWVSPDHEATGGPLAESFLARIGAPLDLIGYVRPLVTNHLAHHHGPGKLRDTTVRRLARKIAPATMNELITVMMADHLGRPPLVSAEALAKIEELRDAAERLEVERAAPQPIVLGRHLISLGCKPGPDFKPMLDAAFESQLDGAFASEEGGLEWMRNYLRAHPNLLK
ncbi:MAG TPA: polynucleotide adenylyltransferase [Candidatus Didemnitutus sp.]|nr:polynucleotide adenylyltransferase [Candidatus Didemnitutus sp.]